LHVRRLVIAVIEDICSFKAKLEFAFLGDGEILQQG